MPKLDRIWQHLFMHKNLQLKIFINNSRLRKIMSSEYGEKLRKIRRAEELTQPEFSQLTGVSLGAIRNYETGQRDVGLSVIDKIVKHPRFGKYTMWLMRGETNPESGQIEPAFSLNGSEVSEKKKQTTSFHTKVNRC
ncbi:helix-turn-helix domain-containing protein [Arsenophonus sp.]|uniref:helix-turn-helix domain-containing protein n=1 Tax=Arsenophonus sp. TaxID=1872640 RepID=UPI00387962C4